jgi:hypothetical protein
MNESAGARGVLNVGYRRRLARGLLTLALTGVVAVGLGGTQPAPAVITTIRVVPDPAMALTDWNALLHVLQLRVVGGPDNAGAYTVAPLGGAAGIQRALQQLRAIRGVRLAEPVAP